MSDIKQAIQRNWRGFLSRLRARRQSKDTTSVEYDELRWSEKFPLYLAVAAQSLVVFRWYLGEQAPAEIGAMLRWLTLAVAVAAGLALDLIVVTTTMGRRAGRESIWSWLTAAAAAAFSAAVAVELYGGPSAGPWLHVSYPVLVFLFAQHLAVRRKQTTTLRSELLERAQLEDTVARLQSELAQAREAVAQPITPGSFDVWSFAQELRNARIPLRRIAALIGVSEGTVRNRTIAITQNGQEEEAI